MEIAGDSMNTGSRGKKTGKASITDSKTQMSSTKMGEMRQACLRKNELNSRTCLHAGAQYSQNSGERARDRETRGHQQVTVR